MLDSFFSHGLALLALVTPISIAATNIVFFPILGIWLLGGRATLSRWPAVWGRPEKVWAIFLLISLASACVGLDPLHSIREIKNKDFYILFSILLVALLRNDEDNAQVMRIFMWAGVFTAFFGLLQCVIGINQTDKSDGIFLYMPSAMVHWPRKILDILSLLNGRAMGTRGHPLAYAECLLFTWALSICFLLSERGRLWIHWAGATALIGAALIVSQSRGPWIAAGVIFFLATLTSDSPRRWPLLALGVTFFMFVVAAPSLRDRARSIMDPTHHSNKERFHMWHAGIELWRSHPVLGIGPGNVKAVSTDFQTADERVWGEWGHLHSTYVNFLAERGAAGLLCFLIFIGALALELVAAGMRDVHDPYRAAVFKGTVLGIIGYLISGVTETSYNTAVVSMTLYFVVGLALALARHGQTSES